MYWVEVKRFGIWRKCKGSEGSEDHAVEYKNDMEYFELREGLKQYRYRIRCDEDRFSLRRWKRNFPCRRNLPCGICCRPCRRSFRGLMCSSPIGVTAVLRTRVSCLNV